VFQESKANYVTVTTVKFLGVNLGNLIGGCILVRLNGIYQVGICMIYRLNSCCRSTPHYSCHPVLWMWPSTVATNLENKNTHYSEISLNVD